MTDSNRPTTGAPIPYSSLKRARLWRASLQILATLQQDFFRHWKKTAATLDADEVHDLRVASRRLREGLALFSPLLPSRRRTRLSRMSKEVTRLLGELRNADEAYLFFRELAAETTLTSRRETDLLLRHLDAEREAHREKVAKELERFDVRTLRRGLRRLIERPNPFKMRAADPFAPWPPFAERALAERAAKVEALLPAARRAEDAAARHRLRIAVKKLRYRLEIVAELAPDQGEAARLALKGYQDLLGKLHDLDVFGELVRERVTDGAGRSELLQNIEGKKAAFFAAFTEMDRSRPLGELAAGVREALREAR